MFLGQTPTTETPPSDQDLSLIDKFKRAVADFTAAYRNLEANEAYIARPTTAPKLKEDYQDTMNKGGIIQASIDKVNAAIEGVKGWFDGMGALGLFPVIALLITGGLLAAIAKWTTDAWTLNAKIEEQKRLESTGLSPAQANALVSKMDGPLFSIGGGNALPLLLMGGLFLFKMMRK